jgi:hypothetical protein
MEIFAGSRFSTVGDQVHLHKARLVFVPVGKGTDWDGIFQQAAGFGRRASPLRQSGASCFQVAIDAGCAHRYQQPFRLETDGQFLVMLQHFHQLSQKGLQPLAAQIPTRLPRFRQRPPTTSGPYFRLLPIFFLERGGGPLCSRWLAYFRW